MGNMIKLISTVLLCAALLNSGKFSTAKRYYDEYFETFDQRKFICVEIFEIFINKVT